MAFKELSGSDIVLIAMKYGDPTTDRHIAQTQIRKAVLEAQSILVAQNSYDVELKDGPRKRRTKG